MNTLSIQNCLNSYLVLRNKRVMYFMSKSDVHSEINFTIGNVILIKLGVALCL